MNDFQYTPPKNNPVSTDDLLNDVRLVSGRTGQQKLSMKAYVESGGKYDPSTILRRFGTWNKALTKAGLQGGNIINYSDEELFENILNIWQHKGKQPTRRDLDSKPSEISQSPYNRRFGSWSEALRRFVEYANEKESTYKPAEIATNGRMRKTGRDISLRLRFNVLKRDHFACVQCGASPAKDSSVELHIDHRKPWSKGGETEIENLQTLCQKCNLGKSNLE